MYSKDHDLTQAQLDSHWMPFTDNRAFKKNPRIIVAAEGKYYTSADGRKVFDSLSGLWCCGAGHAHPKIIQAVSEQVRSLDYAPSFQFGHPKSFEFAERITQFMPEGLNRVFFTGSGSESADTSLKIARAYWRKKGLPAKTKLIGRLKGYHGVNIGGTSLGGIGPNRANFGDFIHADHLPHTALPENKFVRGMPEKGAERADELLELIALHDAANIAAVIVEPLSGSAGVYPPPKGYLKRLREICTQHNILLIFDEVITAFGRMGAKTGSEAFGVVPDMINVAKQLTNGVIPMGAVIVKQEIYDTFMAASGNNYALELLHGYTYSGHPIACSAGLATLNLIEQEGLIERVQEMAPILEDGIHSLKGLKRITDIRNYGLSGAFSLQSLPDDEIPPSYNILNKMWQKGYYVRAGGDTIQLGLPFTVNKDEIHQLIDAFDQSINELF